MSTKEYIELLKSDTTSMRVSALRQALCYYLYSKNVPCAVISHAIRCKRRQVYRRMYACRELLEMKDPLMVESYEETKSHHLNIRPSLIESGICTYHVGYNLTIDNVIY